MQVLEGLNRLGMRDEAERILKDSPGQLAKLPAAERPLPGSPEEGPVRAAVERLRRRAASHS